MPLQAMTGIEKVARAIYRHHAPSLGPLECGEEKGWPRYVAVARAAIEAIREPTEAMIEAAESVDAVYPSEHWAAMLDALMNEKAP